MDSPRSGNEPDAAFGSSEPGVVGGHREVTGQD